MHTRRKSRLQRQLDKRAALERCSIEWPAAVGPPAREPQTSCSKLGRDAPMQGRIQTGTPTLELLT